MKGGFSMPKNILLFEVSVLCSIKRGNMSNFYSKTKSKTKNVAADKISYCTICGVEYRAFITKDCKKCESQNSIHVFDSMMEALRFKALFDDPTISKLSVQFKWKFAMPKAIFEQPYTPMVEPIFKGYDFENLKKRLGYEIDFKYYDHKNYSPWTLEEFKPEEKAVEDSIKVKLNLLYDQLSPDYNICYSYPERSVITVRGKTVYQTYQRKFITRNKADQPRYVEFDAFQEHKNKERVA